MIHLLDGVMRLLSKVYTCATVGLNPYLVEVEVDVGGGLPHFAIVGLPDQSVKESCERVRSAIKNSGFEFPPRRIIVNLAPADIRKEGPGFDLAIAMGILLATEQVGAKDAGRCALVGELALDGSLRGVPGILPMAMFLQNREMAMLVPGRNAAEASLSSDLAYAVDNLAAAAKFMGNPSIRQHIGKRGLESLLQHDFTWEEDLALVKGQRAAKRALEVAAAGGHNILLIGAPGSGKSLLARCLPSILPPLTEREAMEASKIYSIAGLLTSENPLIVRRPFRQPHHTTSATGMIGGGQIPKPGEVTLAVHGVLFLDELPEYRREVLESLRQPLEDHTVTISRLSQAVSYPASFQLVAAANPCYCGFYGDRQKQCVCTPWQVGKYRNKISGPLLDRIDLHVEVPRVTYQELENEKCGEPSALVRTRVIAARERQQIRFAGTSITCNALMTAREVREHCRVNQEGRKILKNAFSALGLSARAHDRILKTARTIADLGGSAEITAAHVAEAIQYRVLDRKT